MPSFQASEIKASFVDILSTEPVTQWFTGESGVKPAYVGEYNASMYRNPGAKRWWNGKYWSELYLADDHWKTKQKARKTKESEALQDSIDWRGLTNDDSTRTH